MSKKKFFEAPEYDGLCDTLSWAPVNTEDYTPEQLAEYTNKKEAIIKFFKYESPTKICAEHKMSYSTLIRLAKRCLSLKSDGTIYGFSGLISYKRIKTYYRTAELDLDKVTSGYSGAFRQLLNRYPDIDDVIHFMFLKHLKGSIRKKKISKDDIHRTFLRMCTKKGIHADEYPFCTKTQGKKSLYNYLNELAKSKCFKDYISQNCSADANTLVNTTGIGEKNNPICVRPFERVEFDAHKIDAIFIIEFTTLHGDKVKQTLSRIWLLTIIDVATRTVLGYSLSYRLEYSSVDVLRCIRNAMLPHKKLELTIPDLVYPSNGGFHSIAIPQTEYACWDQLCYDNAKSHLSQMVINKLNTQLKCAVNAGPVATPTARPYIERFFGTLEERGYHKLVNTTGSNPNDNRRNNPEQQAMKYSISCDVLEQLTEIVIAQYNNTPHRGIAEFTPLQLMKDRIERGMIPRVIKEENRSDLQFITMTVNRVIKGDIKKGRRPYINYENVRYTSDVLANSPHLIGKKLKLVINLEDLRFVRAFFEEDGSEFGFLRAHGEWGVIPHDLKTRKTYSKLDKKQQLQDKLATTPVEAVENYLIANAAESKKACNALAAYNKEKSESQLTPTEDANIQFPNTPTSNKLLEEQKKIAVNQLMNSKILKPFS